MKRIFIEMRRKTNLSDVNLNILNKLPGKTISLAATIQYLNFLPIVKEFLERLGKKVVLKRGAYYAGHVLGCNSSAFDKNADTLLLLADGKFHAMNNAVQLQREIFIFTTKTLEKITKKEIEEIKRANESKKKKFLISNEIGFIISTKYGQRIKSFKGVVDKIKKLGKKVYIFEADNIDFSEFENFPRLKIWVNSACYGLGNENKKIINLSDIVEFL